MHLLTFDLQGTLYAVPLDAIAEVLPAPALRRLPIGPPGVLGLAEAGGRVIAVLDLASLLEAPAEGGTPEHLVRLAAPHHQSALSVRGRIRIGTGVPVAGVDSGSGGRSYVAVGGTPHILLDPTELIRRASGG